MKHYLNLEDLTDESVERVLRLNAYLKGTSFYDMPASARHHGNRPGGLYEHSAAVFDSLMELTKKLNLQWLRPESPYIIAFGHDVCKIDAYTMREPGWEKVSDDGYGNVEYKCRYCGCVYDEKRKYCPKCDAHMGEWINNPKHSGRHADLSLDILREAGIELTDEERACIRWHMGAFDDPQNWSNYTSAIRMFPNVLWTHTADMVAAHINNI